MSNHRLLNRINFQNGIDVSSPALSPESQAALSDGSWNSIVSGSGLTRPWSGATAQTAGGSTNDTGSTKMLPFGDTWGGIKSIAYSNKTFTTADAGADTVAITGHNYNTGLACTLSGGGLPTGLSAGPTYYIIRVTADTISFATSLANAVAGTPVVDITATGAGTVNVTTTSIAASGSFFQDVGRSRWGIGSGIPHIAGENVAGFTLSTNLQLQVASSGSYSTPVEAGLGQPSAPEVGIIDGSVGDISASISVKIERTRPSTGARSLASPSSAVIVPQANKVRVTFDAASTGQTHWRVYFTFHGFGGTGVYYLGSYLDLQDIPETMVAAGTVGGSATVATGTLTFGANPADGETMLINGVTLTFRAVAPASGEVQIGSTSADTAINLAAVLTASLNPLLSVATYTLTSSTVLTVTYGSAGTAGNSFDINNSSSANITAGTANLTGGAQGDITRSLEFNYKDGDLLPIEASYDDYPPPAATHALRIQNVLCLAGCYSDSTSDPTSSSTGTAIAVSKENNYESYVPTSLLFLPEPVIDCLARPIDDYGYVACQNSIHAVQYIGDRGDGLPSCTLTTILPDIGIQYPQNWCSFKGRLLIYAGEGQLMMMDESGNWDTDFAAPVSKLLKGLATAYTSVAYDPLNDSIVVFNRIASNVTRMLVYSLQLQQWRQVWLPDYSLTGEPQGCVTMQRRLYFTLLNTSTGIYTAYTYDTGSSTAPLTFCCNYQGANGAEVQDVYALTLAAQVNVNTVLAMVINRDLSKTVFRRIGTTGASANITDGDSSFTSDMTGKTAIVFGTDVGGAGVHYLKTTVASVGGASAVTLGTVMGATLTNALMFVGSFGATPEISAGIPHLPDFQPHLPGLRSHQVAVWFRSSGDIGNVLSADVVGTSYSSRRAL